MNKFQGNLDFSQIITFTLLKLLLNILHLFLQIPKR